MTKEIYENSVLDESTDNIEEQEAGFCEDAARNVIGVVTDCLMLIGLAHDRIIYLGMAYIERGYITQDEYENLYEYLYKPYEKLGGNGSAKRIMTEVDQLAIHKSTYNA